MYALSSCWMRLLLPGKMPLMVLLALLLAQALNSSQFRIELRCVKLTFSQ